MHIRLHKTHVTAQPSPIDEHESIEKGKKAVPSALVDCLAQFPLQGVEHGVAGGCRGRRGGLGGGCSLLQTRFPVAGGCSTVCGSVPACASRRTLFAFRHRGRSHSSAERRGAGRWRRAGRGRSVGTPVAACCVCASCACRTLRSKWVRARRYASSSCATDGAHGGGRGEVSSSAGRPASCSAAHCACMISPCSRRSMIACRSSMRLFLVLVSMCGISWG